MTAVAGRKPRVIAVGGLQRCVSDLARSVDFYCGALGFEVVDSAGSASMKRASLLLGRESIELIQVCEGSLPAPASAPDPRFQHAAIVAADMAAAWRRLRAFAPSLISLGGPQRLPANAGGVTAFKFRDPDGHPLELIHFPRGVGDTCWHASAHAASTLGIDHFALAVNDVERSIALFTRLGFSVASRQVNHGVTQSRLDGLTQPVVEIVAMTVETQPTPHLELLAYRQPEPPRDSPQMRPLASQRDIVRLIVDATADECALFDPDGHALQLIGRAHHAR